MLDSDSLKIFLLRCDWLLPRVASITTKMLKLILDGNHLAKDSFSTNDVDACSNV